MRTYRNERKIHPIVRVPERAHVQVEPELAFMIEHHTAAERLELARKFDRWSHQIRLQLTVCVNRNGNWMPAKVKEIPEPRRHVQLCNN